MGNEPRNQFTFYKSYYDAICDLPKRDQSALILALCAYAIYEEEPKGLSCGASTAFKLIKPTLDSSRRKASGGARGGQASSKQSASKAQASCKHSESKAQGYDKQIASEKEYEVEIENEIEVEVEGEEKASAFSKAPDLPDGGCGGESVGEYCDDPDTDDENGEDGEAGSRLYFLGGIGRGVVKLSDDQIDSLLGILGKDMFDYYVDRLADFITDKHARVFNHYDLILKWYREDSSLRGTTAGK